MVSAPPVVDARLLLPLPANTMPASGPEPSAPRVHSTTDPDLFWLNRRPFLIHTSCGKGAFGDVFKVEMMVPLGYEVGRDANGSPVFEADGFVAVRRVGSGSPSNNIHGGDVVGGAQLRAAAGGEFAEDAGRAGAGEDHPLSYESSSFLFPSIGASSFDEEVLAALELSEESPEAMSFFEVAGAEGIVQKTVVNPRPEDVAHNFIVDESQFVVACGVFFALKIQAARSEQMMTFFTQEIENLRALQGHGAEDHIIQIR